MSVVGLVLAAGGGSRMGGPKAVVEYRGEPLITSAVRTAFAGGCDVVCAVLGAETERAASYAEAAGAFVTVNEAWADGMGVSLRAGLDAIGHAVPEASAALVLLVDQPDITAEAIAAVLGARTEPDDEAVLAAAVYEGQRGHPVLIGRAHWSALRPTLTGDVGARAYLREHRDELILVPCDAVADPRDLDRPEDLH
ncbi:MAG TPA: nucleotidyltransferase family protein [Actinospica sp.]|jgi:nicotine blue oxidoreductase|nr:nucleotidyltransferase family protein [Actinospica sp.]